jgi:hypothetical protein
MSVEEPLVRGRAGGVAELAGELALAERAAGRECGDRQWLVQPLHRPFQAGGEPFAGREAGADGCLNVLGLPPARWGGATI